MFFNYFCKISKVHLKAIFFLVLLLLLFSCNKSQESKSKAIISLDSISVCLNNQNLKLSEKEIDYFYSVCDKNVNSQINRLNISNISVKYFNFNNLDKFKISSRKLSNLSLASNDSLNLAKSYRFLAGYYKDVNVYDSSFYYYLKSEKIYKKADDLEDYAIVLLYKSVVQYYISDFLGSDITAKSSYQILKGKKNYEKTYSVLTQLGLVSTELKEYGNAINYHKKALEIVRENKLNYSYNQQSVCFNNIGYLYLKQGEYDKAIENFKLGLEDLTLKNIDPDLYSLLIDNLGYSKLKINNLDNVPQLFQNALKIRDSLKDSNAIIRSNIHLSEYYDAIKDTTFSIRYSKKALQLAKDSKSPFDIVLSLKQAAAVDKKNASAYTSDYIRISDSLQDVERKNKDRFARIQLETDELIKENVFLTEKNKRIIYSMFALGTIVLVTVYSRTQFLKNKYLLLEQSQQRANEDIYRLVISEQDNIEQGKNLEKKRIAKELHDGVLGRLFGLRLNLDMLNSRDDDNVSKDRKSFLNELQLIEQDIREISHELSREKIALINNFLSLTNVLFENQVKIGKAKLKTEIDSTINWDLLSNSTRINLYRILQEALQNVNKYAKAKNISISFKKDINGNLILSIFDNGIGFNVEEKSKGIGLTNIFSRIDESNGTIKINSERKKGTSILIVIPLESKTIKS